MEYIYNLRLNNKNQVKSMELSYYWNEINKHVESDQERLNLHHKQM